MMTSFFKIINILLLSTVKYFYTPIYSHMIGVDLWTTMLVMIPGGVLGFFLFYYFSKILLLTHLHIKPLLRAALPDFLLRSYRVIRQKRRMKKSKRKKFTRRNRLIVRLTAKYGLYTLVFLTPVLISLILGAFLLRKYYPNRKEAIPLMVVAIVTEGILLCVGYWYLMGELI